MMMSMAEDTVSRALTLAGFADIITDTEYVGRGFADGPTKVRPLCKPLLGKDVRVRYPP